MRSTRDDPVKERRWAALASMEVSIGSPHPEAKPRANDSDGLNPRRIRRRQCEGTGTKTVPGGGGGQAAAIQRPSRFPGSARPPYFMRCKIWEVPRSAHKRNPNACGRAPARSCPSAKLLGLGGSTGHARRHPGHVPATSFANKNPPHSQHRPKPNQVRHMNPKLTSRCQPPLCDFAHVGAALTCVAAVPSWCEIWETRRPPGKHGLDTPRKCSRFHHGRCEIVRRRPFSRSAGGRNHVDHSALARDSVCLLYTSPSPRDATLSRMPSSA